LLLGDTVIIDDIIAVFFQYTPSVSDLFGIGAGTSAVLTFYKEKVVLRSRTTWIMVNHYIKKSPKKVYIFTDCLNSNITRDIAIKLNGDKKNHITPLDNAEDLLWIPKSQNTTQAIIIILTDVLPLSSNATTRRKIQKELLDFTKCGGTLILGHDVLYRRTKNQAFTDAMGCQLTIFERRDKKISSAEINNSIQNSDGWVEYEKNPQIINTDLPKNFRLRDNEVVTSNEWADLIRLGKIIPIYRERKTGYILVAKKHHGNGHIFWINSGDHADDKSPPESLKEPSVFFIQLLNFLIENKDLEIRPS